jgi:hypothetical protein
VSCRASAKVSRVVGSVNCVTDTEYNAAWVPDDDPERSWDDAAAPAVEWTLQEAKRQGAEPLLVTPTQSQWTSGADSIRWFAQRYAATTPRSKRPGGGIGPVVVYVPDYDTVHLAAGYARGSSLAVIESVSHPLIGWAMETKALNLITMQPTADTRSAEQLKALESIHFNGNNGWSRGFGQDQAKRVLSDMQAKGILDRDMVLGTMVARGHYGDSVERLGKVIDRLV